MIELHMRSTHLPTKMASIFGILYLLEANMSEVTSQVLPHVIDYLMRTLTSVTSSYVPLNKYISVHACKYKLPVVTSRFLCVCSHTTIHCQPHLLLVWSCAFFICEHCSQNAIVTDFIAKIHQVTLLPQSIPIR